MGKRVIFAVDIDGSLGEIYNGDHTRVVTPDDLKGHVSAFVKSHLSLITKISHEIFQGNTVEIANFSSGSSEQMDVLLATQNDEHRASGVAIVEALLAACPEAKPRKFMFGDIASIADETKRQPGETWDKTPEFWEILAYQWNTNKKKFESNLDAETAKGITARKKEKGMNARIPSDTGKISSLYALAQNAIKDKDCETEIRILDDRNDDILQPLAAFYKNNSKLLPSNINCKTYHYESGNFISEGPTAVFSGTGCKHENYYEVAKSLLNDFSKFNASISEERISSEKIQEADLNKLIALGSDLPVVGKAGIKPKKTIHALDGDGCILLHEPNNDTKFIEKVGVSPVTPDSLTFHANTSKYAEHHPNLLANFKDGDEIISFSFRTDTATDIQNTMKMTGFGPVHTTSITSVLEHIVEAKRGLTLNKGLYSDASRHFSKHGNHKKGETWDEIKEGWKDAGYIWNGSENQWQREKRKKSRLQEHPNSDQNKISLLFDMAHKLAKEHNASINNPIEIILYDDFKEILDSLHAFYENNLHILPAGVRIVAKQYYPGMHKDCVNDPQTLYQFQGTGVIYKNPMKAAEAIHLSECILNKRKGTTDHDPIPAELFIDLEQTQTEKKFNETDILLALYVYAHLYQGKIEIDLKNYIVDAGFIATFFQMHKNALPESTSLTLKNGCQLVAQIHGTGNIDRNPRKTVDNISKNDTLYDRETGQIQTTFISLANCNYAAISFATVATLALAATAALITLSVLGEFSAVISALGKISEDHLVGQNTFQVGGISLAGSVVTSATATFAYMSHKKRADEIAEFNRNVRASSTP